MMNKQDQVFVKAILPTHYTVQESKQPGNIHCVSQTGIVNSKGEEDEQHWDFIMSALKKYFGPRFQEVDHNTCYCHVDFTIFIKQDKTS